ncbi:MAG: ferrous iron transport protein B [Euryarchaeota archaeon]|nr:ferrous iron transport protein B [Euryarchaeota archaeon]
MRLVLMGNPNVGKSALFTRITGIGVISANYPGTSVEFEEAVVTHEGKRITVFDLPGTYSLAGATEDEKVATSLLFEKRPDCVVAVVDATRLEQNLVLVLQLIELGYRVVVALNFMDQARKRYSLDVDKLSNILGTPIIPTVATTGEGIDELMHVIVQGCVPRSSYVTRYDSHIEAFLEDMARDQAFTDEGFPIRGALIKLLEGNELFEEQFPDHTIDAVEDFRETFRLDHGEDVEVHISRDRYGESGLIATSSIGKLEGPMSLRERASELTIRPITGIPILLTVLLGIFLSVVLIGGYLEDLLVDTYLLLIGDFFDQMAAFIGGDIGEIIASSINVTIEAMLEIVIPYVLVFYILLGLLEDSGYLPRVVMLLDGIMVKLGLHGRTIIPMIVGTGCNVPAILATRTLDSRRQRLILATIIVVAVPCTAQTVIIIGTVGKASGIFWAGLIYLILIGLALLLGRILHKVLKAEPPSLAIEIPDLAVPSARNILLKTWMRMKEFFVIAFPLLLVGSLILTTLLNFDILDVLVGPLTPLTEGLLGLPPVIIIALIFGILRKEMSLQILFVIFALGTGGDLGTVLSPQQMFVFALVMATYMPCLGVLAALVKEFGAKSSVVISAASIGIALTLGIIANYVFKLFAVLG